VGSEMCIRDSHFRVRAVPQTVINRRAVFLGALAEPDFVAATLEAAGVPVDDVHEHPDGPTSDVDAGR